MKLITNIASKASFSVPTDDFMRAYPEIDSSQFLIHLESSRFYLLVNAFVAEFGGKTELIFTNKKGDINEFEYLAEDIPQEVRHHNWERKNINSLDIDSTALEEILLKILKLKPVAGPAIIVSTTPHNFIQTKSSLIIEDFDSIDDIFEDDNLTLLSSLMGLLFKEKECNAVVIDSVKNSNTSIIIAQPGKLIDPISTEENLNQKLSELSIPLHSIKEALYSIRSDISNNQDNDNYSPNSLKSVLLNHDSHLVELQRLLGKISYSIDSLDGTVERLLDTYRRNKNP